MHKVKIGLLGLGTVGAGVVNALQSNPRFEIVIAGVSDLNKPRNCETPFVLTTDGLEVVQHPEIDIVIECMGGQEPANTWIRKAFAQGKSVITANKALLAHQGLELTALAQKHGVSLKYEASVGGAIPIIATLQGALASNRIESIRGILNGTSNYILTQMTYNKISFAEALKNAQAAGYAEADPHFDIAGVDAAHKITLLARLAFHCPVAFASVEYTGIEKVTLEDIKAAQAQGCKIKLIAEAKRIEGELKVSVRPMALLQTDLLAQVDGVLNAIAIQSDLAGQSILIGEGAGAKATASAILADLCELQDLF